MKLGCRWLTDPPCKQNVSSWRRIILDSAPVALIGLCADHTNEFDRAVTRGGLVVDQALGKAVTVRPA